VEPKTSWFWNKINKYSAPVEEFILYYSQYMEYKISHFVDKSFESCFGFISVLPGAYSMFRWDAIKGDPLNSFF